MYESNLLEGKHFIITGGGTGLGLSMGLRFAELGANLTICGRRQEKLDEGAQQLTDKGANVVTYSMDVRKPEEVEAMVKAAVEGNGPITHLINNAAGNFPCPTEMLSYNAFSAVVGIVLHGSFNCSLAVGRKFIEQGSGGNIISIIAAYAWTGSAFVVPSVCGKAGVLAMTRSLSVEWAKHKIRVNAIAPGPFPTKGAWDRLVPNEAAAKASAERIPAKRHGDHPELANLATYLASDQSDYITGECITIDGAQQHMGGLMNQIALMSGEELSAFMAGFNEQKSPRAGYSAHCGLPSPRAP